MKTSFGGLACALLLLVGSTYAAPVTYDLIATPSATGNVSGFVTWDSTLVPGVNNSNLTLANALAWTFSYSGSALSDFSISIGATIFADSTNMSGVFGTQDLTPESPHVWIVVDGTVSSTTAISLDGADPLWQATFTFIGRSPIIDSGRGWFLQLRSTVPEPSSVLLIGLAMGAVMARKRRKRQS